MPMHELSRYLQPFRPYLPGLVVAALLLSLTALLPGAVVVLLQEGIDAVLQGEAPARLLPIATGLPALALLDAVLLWSRTRLTKGIAWGVTSDLRRRLHAHFLALGADQQGSTGQRLAALTAEVDELQYGVSALVAGFREPLTLLVLAATAVWMAPPLVPWALAVVPCVLLATRWGGQLMERRARTARLARAELVDLAQEQLVGLPTIQAFAAEAGERQRFREVEEADRRARVRLESDRVVPRALVRVIGATAASGLLLVGARLVVHGQLAPGELVGFAVAVGLTNRPLSGLSEVWALLRRSLAALERVQATLHIEPSVRAPIAPAQLGPRPVEVVWEDVGLDRGDGPILAGVNLIARPGEVLALAGPSGAGKTSLLRMVQRALEPTRGSVRFGGQDVRDLHPSCLRQAVGVVPQDAFLFARTIRDNVSLGREASDEEVVRALERAGASFVFGLPSGIDTPLNELGHRLSGGERQRLCLARALLVDAPVLLLDEPTNQVDPETEEAILGALEGLRHGRTIVVAAHGAAVLRAADRVAVVEQGRVQMSARAW